MLQQIYEYYRDLGGTKRHVVALAAGAALSLIAFQINPTFGIVATVFIAAAIVLVPIVEIRVEQRSLARRQTLELSLETRTAVQLEARFPGVLRMPLSNASMSATNVHLIIDELDRLDGDLVVEFGSGLSTLAVAAWMKERGRGKIVTFEHHEFWAQECRRIIEKVGLSEFAEVRHAPLAPLSNDAGGAGADWYDLTGHVDDINDVALMIVDGPPAGSSKPTSRYPALPQMAERLAAHCVVVLDDGDRPGEQKVAARWQAEFPAFDVRERFSHKGMWTFSRTGGHTGD